MAYPASTKTLQQWVADVDRQASGVKSAAQLQHSRSAGNLLRAGRGGRGQGVIAANVAA